MKAVLISIRPKWCELIASGKKTVEVRKTRPKIDTPFKCYIYCTKDEPMYHSGEKFLFGDDWGNGKVIGEFVCKKTTYIDARIDSDGDRHLGNTLFLKRRMCLSDDELFSYLYKGENENNGGWAWGISDLVIYHGMPKELSEFRLPCDHKNDCCTCNRAKYCIDPINSEYQFHHCELEKGLKRPPQSWCYVEEL